MSGSGRELENSEAKFSTSKLYAAIMKNRVMWITLALVVFFLATAASGMSTKDWVITLLRGLSVGSVTFLVASGFSLIFGLLDVLNLAHGTLFMIGAYVGWTTYIRPDTTVDVLPVVALLAAGFMLGPVWAALAARIRLGGRWQTAWPWLGLAIAVGLLFWVLPDYPITAWEVDVYSESPGTYAFMADQGQLVLPAPKPFAGLPPGVVLGGLLLSGLLGAFSLAGLRRDRSGGPGLNSKASRLALVSAAILALLGLLVHIFNDGLTAALVGLGSTGLFFLAVLIAVLTGMGMGALMESALIRPLYARPIYQLMLTLGLSAVGIEVVRAIWGRTEFVMPKPALFNGTGEGCPATSLGDWLAHQCSTVMVLDGRVRVYNEIFIPLVGLVVLVAVWLLLKRSRLGMIIRAGVQDREMVEALGINVKQVFTLVFGLGVGLAALGGALAGPSTGLSNAMGESLFLNALIALAIGGLTSYPGAAVGSVLVGLLQQYIIKYGAIGIPIPFTEQVFKPTPPLVPASTVLLMVVVLLLLPQGLFGKKE